MHTHVYQDKTGQDWTVHHNGDYSGEVWIMAPRFAKGDAFISAGEAHIPFEILEQIVAAKLADDLMSTVEEMDPVELLYRRRVM